jgi:transposase-like protein
MNTIRKKHPPQFKFKVALEAAKEIKTLNELASQYSVHTVQISQWKKQLIEEGPEVFSKHSKPSKNNQQKVECLYEQIGKLTMELDWFKKKFSV